VVIGDACHAQAPPEDGVQYHIHPVLPASSDLAERAAEIGASVEFLWRNQPALVCSDLGDGLSAVVCAAFLASSQPTAQCSGNVAADGLRRVEERRGPLSVEIDDVEALETYCAGLPIALRTPPSRPRLIDSKRVPGLTIGGAHNGTKREMKHQMKRPFAELEEVTEEEPRESEEILTPNSKVAVPSQGDSVRGDVKARLLGRVSLSPSRDQVANSALLFPP